jgi:hypothetical protein
MSWAESINDDRMRTRLMKNVAASWKRDEPDSFEAYLKEGDLTDAQKATLINNKSGGGNRKDPVSDR